MFAHCPSVDTIDVNYNFTGLCFVWSQYSVPVVKYDRNGFRPRFRQLIFTQVAAYLVEEGKVKQRMEYTSLKGNYGD